MEPRINNILDTLSQHDLVAEIDNKLDKIIINSNALNHNYFNPKEVLKSKVVLLTNVLETYIAQIRRIEKEEKQEQERLEIKKLDEEFERQMQEAIEISKKEMIEEQKAAEKKIKQNLLCPISGKLMENPVFCILDEKTYDRQHIETELLAKGKTPGGKELSTSQKINDVLFDNFAVAEMIDHYREENPELFNKAPVLGM